MDKKFDKKKVKKIAIIAGATLATGAAAIFLKLKHDEVKFQFGKGCWLYGRNEATRKIVDWINANSDYMKTCLDEGENFEWNWKSGNEYIS